MAVTRALPSLRVPIPRRRATAHSSPRALAVFALLGANAIWGGSAAASKAALVHVPPLTLACLRVAVALVVLRVLLALRRERPATGGGPALLGLTGVAVFCAGQNLGLRSASAGTTALLNGAIPVLTALMAAVFLGERPGGRRLAALLISLAGIVVLVVDGSGPFTAGGALADLLPLVSVVGFAAYAVLGRRVFAGGDALAIVAGSTRYGLFFLLPGACVELATAAPGRVTAGDALLILYLGAGCSALAFVLGGYGLAHLEASHGAGFGNVKPLVGIALAVILLGEPLTGGQFGGGALVLAGVVLASRLPTARTGDPVPVRPMASISRTTSAPEPIRSRDGDRRGDWSLLNWRTETG
ncbi:MAG TPA: DMT family transporter [Thermomicrobiales bacterium]|jgi:drug/metabolite transporter (DMT)-like permease